MTDFPIGTVRLYWWVPPEQIPTMLAADWAICQSVTATCLHHRYRFLMVREALR